jgi:hypothetical protein
MKAVNKKLGLLAICAGALTLVACGGDSATVPLTVKGVAATGLAIENGIVNVQCFSGSGGPVRTLPNGSYSISMNNATGPCLVTVEFSGKTYYSISKTTTDGVAIANVTPISDSIVRSLVTAKGAPNVTSLVSNPDYKPSDENISSAVTAAITAIQTINPSFPSDFDLLGSRTFEAATLTTQTDDPLDNLLDDVAPGGVLNSNLNTVISTNVNVVVDPNVTGGTGGTGGN